MYSKSQYQHMCTCTQALHTPTPTHTHTALVAVCTACCSTLTHAVSLDPLHTPTHTMSIALMYQWSLIGTLQTTPSGQAANQVPHCRWSRLICRVSCRSGRGLQLPTSCTSVWSCKQRGTFQQMNRYICYADWRVVFWSTQHNMQLGKLTLEEGSTVHCAS